MNNQLEAQRNALGIREGGLQFVLHGEVVQDLEDEGAETGRFEDLD